MPATVLDSHALVACFRDEPGAGRVETLLTNSVPADLLLQMTKVNYAKVMYTLIRKDGPAAWEAAAQVLVGLPIEFQPVDRALADGAADFKARHKLSPADAFADALAKRHKAELVTGDPEFKAVEKEIKVHWLAS